MWRGCVGSRIDLVVFDPVGRLTMLQWRPRLVVLVAVVALIVIALVGGDIEDVLLNLYW
jgi:hypothetical protein